MEQQHKQRGGNRPNAGRPEKGKDKRIKVAITLRPDHHLATTMNRSFMIEQALDMLLEKNKAQL